MVEYIKMKQIFLKTVKKIKRYVKNKYITPPPLVAVINLHGVILAPSRGRSGLSLEEMVEAIELAFKLPKLKAVALSVNSPGGSPVQSELIYKRIRQLADKNKIPIYSFAEDVAASGGYWLACAADEIFASNSSIIGSIGVISASFGFDEMIKRLGISRRVYTQGENKSILDPFSPEKETDIQILKSVQADIHESFKSLVRERRKDKLKIDEERLFSGEFWSGKTALELGLIDGIGDLYSVLQEKYGNRVKLKRMARPKSWLKKRLGIFMNVFTDTIEKKVIESSLWNRFGL
ncbi:Peptidase S49 [Rickettsiales bacterium Ac37b]|nr:Peptidase S49 [Rickettsiales bacterium Ac37b]